MFSFAYSINVNTFVPFRDMASSHMVRRIFVGAAYKAVRTPNIVGNMELACGGQLRLQPLPPD